MTTRTAGYIDQGDRVVVSGNSFVMGSDDLADHLGKHGLVESNNGWGLCRVLLDDGTTIIAWSDGDLVREA